MSLLNLPIDFEYEDCEWEPQWLQIFASTTEQLNEPRRQYFYLLSVFFFFIVLMGSWFISLLQRIMGLTIYNCQVIDLISVSK